VAPAPAPAAAPAPVAAPADPSSQTTTTSMAELAPEQPKKENSMFVGIDIGAQMYNNSPDVKNFGDFRLSVGKVMDSNFSVAGEFGYNSLNQDLSWDGELYRSVSQYTFGAVGRYVFPVGRFRPNAGVALDYVRTSYGGMSLAGYQSDVSNLGATGSNALNYGIVAGFDIKVSDHLMLGIDYRYMMNLTYEYDNQTIYNTANAYGLSPLESRNYQTFTGGLKFTY